MQSKYGVTAKHAADIWAGDVSDTDSQRRSTPTAVSGAWPHCQHAAEPRPMAPTPRPPPGPLCSLSRPPCPVQWRHPVGVGRLVV
eukprot:scaffold44240_cov59-Phaeocystis_antarctica.AAC.6